MLHELIRDRSITKQDPIILHRHIHTKKWKNLILSNQEFQRKSRSSGVTCLDLDHCFSSYLMAGSQDSSLVIYDLESSCEVLVEFERGKAHAFEITDVGWFTNDSNVFITASKDQSVKLWDSNTLNNVIVWRMNSPVNCKAIPSYHSSPLLVAVGMDGKHIRMCDLKSGASTHTLKGHNGSVLSMEWSPFHPNILVSGSTDGSIKYWDIRKASPCLMSLDYSNGSGSASHDGAVKGLCFASNGLILVSVGADKLIRLWDAYSGKSTGIQGPWNYSSLYSSVKPLITHFDDTERPILYLPNNKHIQEYDLWTLDPLNSHYGHYGRVNCLALDRSRASLYSVRLFDFSICRELQIKKYYNGLEVIMFRNMAIRSFYSFLNLESETLL